MINYLVFVTEPFLTKLPVLSYGHACIIISAPSCGTLSRNTQYRDLRQPHPDTDTSNTAPATVLEQPALLSPALGTFFSTYIL